MATRIEVIPTVADARAQMRRKQLEGLGFAGSISFDGYFNAYDEMPDAVVAAQTFGMYHSNEIEILYLNCFLLNNLELFCLITLEDFLVEEF